MKRSNLKGTGVNVILLGIVSFLNDMSSEMIIPILPMFISALGGTLFVMGVIGGFQDSISSILKVLSGYWSDRVGKRKVFVLSGYLTSASFKLLLSFSSLWQHILLFASFERVGKGLRTAPRDAIIADSLPEAHGKGFGIHRALDTAGAIIGSVMVLILLLLFAFHLEQIAEQISFYQSVIFIAAIISFCSVLPLHFVKESRKRPMKERHGLQISIRMLPAQLKIFIMVATLFGLANFTYMFFILKAERSFAAVMPVKESIALTLMLYIFFNIFYAAFAIPFGTLSDSIGRRKVLTMGYFMFALTCLGFAFADSIYSFAILFPLYGIVYAMVDGNQRAFVADLSTADLRATALGTFHTMIGIISLPASIIAGALGMITPALTFIFGACVSSIAGLLFVALRNRFL